MDVPTSAERVAIHTSKEINQRIQRQKDFSVAYYTEHPDEIDERLKELDREWDVERVLETNAATLSLATTVLGILFKRRWLLFSGAVSGFLLQHGIQGWCPPLPVLRRLGFRTVQEIDEERYALLQIRGSSKKKSGGNGNGAKQKNEPPARVRDRFE